MATECDPALRPLVELVRRRPEGLATGDEAMRESALRATKFLFDQGTSNSIESREPELTYILCSGGVRENSRTAHQLSPPGTGPIVRFRANDSLSIRALLLLFHPSLLFCSSSGYPTIHPQSPRKSLLRRDERLPNLGTARVADEEHRIGTRGCGRSRHPCGRC